jgi:hypothetical protein
MLLLCERAVCKRGPVIARVYVFPRAGLPATPTPFHKKADHPPSQKRVVFDQKWAQKCEGAPLCCHK